MRVLRDGEAMKDPFPTRDTLVMRWDRIGNRMVPRPLPGEVRRAMLGVIAAERTLRVEGPSFANRARYVLAFAWHRFVRALFPL